ncbi:AI-2E family transporter [Lacipirellula limnantheis]|uniref:AI-2 transport protein TqsA n=1 Tax=Lacipirellula limnantheis TaxID=2528024 RepID=A0A517U4D8_9BACT|nr:AI-2E family transporter [Lacipirellula limnantheis]QDT75496.1 AI-2 transport protein TqsA [Lacipirellula limnantheis]
MARTRSTGSGSPLLTLASIVVAIAALHLAKEILVPLALAIFLSFLLTPLADRLESWGLGRIPSVISVVAVTFMILGLLGWIVTSQLVDLSVQLPDWKDEIIVKIQELKPDSAVLDKVTQTIDEVSQKVSEEAPPSGSDADATSPAENSSAAGTSAKATEGTGLLDRLTQQIKAPANQEPMEVRVVGLPPSPLEQIQNWLGPIVAPLSAAGIAIVLVIFILLRREDQRNRLLQLFGASNLHASTEALTDVTERVSKYLRMQFLINAGYGICVGVGLATIGVPSAITWGVLSFSLRFLPYIGPWLSAVMPLTVSLATSTGWTEPMFVAGLFIVLELLVNNVAEPMLYGRSTGVSGVGVIIAAIFWTWVWGPIGLVLAMPLTVCVVVMSKYIPGLQFLSILLGDQSALSAPERIYQRLLAGDCEEAVEQAAEMVTTGSLVESYDQGVIPALMMAENDRHGGRLHDEQTIVVYETARDLVDDLDELAAARDAAVVRDGAVTADKAENEVASDREPLRVLCIPLRDEADDIGAAMLSKLLSRERVTVELGAVTALTSELVDSVDALHVDVVVLSIVPPLPPRSSRLLCRRLHDRYPQLPVVIGFWGAGKAEDIRRRLADDQSEVVTTLAAAVDRVKAIAARPQLAGKAS